MAMHNNAVSVPEVDITCTLCNKPYSSPKLVDCLHTYCQTCIQKNIKKESTNCRFKCPQCLHVTYVEGTSVDSLVSDLHVTGLIEIFNCHANERSKCFVCLLKRHTSQATNQCLDCGDRLCENCSKGHNFSSVTSSHRVVCLDDLRRGQYDQELLRKRVILCDKHTDEACSIFCQTCSKPTCLQCTLTDHKDHNYEHIEEAAEKKRVVLTDTLIASATHAASKVDKSEITVAEEELNQLQKEEEIFVRNITDTTDFLIAKLQRESQAVLQKGRQGFAEEREKREKRLNIAVRESVKKENIIRLCSTLTQIGRLEIVVMSGVLRKGLALLSESKCNNYDTALTTYRATCVLPVDKEMVTLHKLDFSSSIEKTLYLQMKPCVDAVDTTGQTKCRSSFVLPIGKQPLIVPDILSSSAEIASNQQLLQGLDETSARKDVEVLHKSAKREPIKEETYVEILPKLSSTSCDNVSFKKLTFRRHFSTTVGSDGSESEISSMVFRTSNSCLVLDRTNDKLKVYKMSGDLVYLVGQNGKCKPFEQFVNMPSNQMIAAIYENCLLILTNHLQIQNKITLLLNKGITKPIVGNFADNIIIGNLPDNEMRVLNTSGKLLKTWKSQVDGEMKSINYAGKDIVITCTWQGKGSVYMESEKRGILTHIQGQERNGLTWRPSYALADTKGHIIVTDSLRNEVSVFSLSGNCIFTLDVTGDKLSEPNCLFLDTKGNMYLSSKGGRVAVYELKYWSTSYK